MLTACYRQEVERRGREFQDDEATRKHIASFARWITGGSRKAGLFLYGDPGNGKSTLARAAAQMIRMVYAYEDRYEDRKGVITVSALDLTDIAKNEEGTRLRKYKQTELLHIDDVGTEPVSVKVWGNEISPLVEILYSRYDAQLYTVITSNLYEEDVFKRYGARIDDRFREMFDFINFENRSYR